MLGELVWKRAERDEAFHHFDRAASLVDGRQPSRSVAYVVGNLSRYSMLAGDLDDAGRLGREALAMARELGFRDLEAHALNNIGTVKASTGDRDGLADLRRSIEISEPLSSPEAQRGYVNLASVTGLLGDLAACRRLHEQGLEVARRLGHAGGIRWLTVELVLDRYWAGEWEEALAGAEAFLAECETSPHYMEHGARWVRAAIRLARGDAAGAVADSARALAVAREAKDPQNLYPMLGAHARFLAAAGQTADARAAIDELLVRVSAATVPAAWLIDAAFASPELDRTGELVESVRLDRSPWRDAIEAIAGGDLRRAADVLEAIGSLPDAAYARLLAAEGSREGRGPELRAALAFFRRVGATAYLRRGEALLAASA